MKTDRLTTRWCLFLYACLVGLCVGVHSRLLDGPAIEARRELHAQVLHNTAPAPLQYRVLTCYAAEGIQRLGRALGFQDPFQASYLILRWVFTFVAAFLLHRFLLIYLPLPLALAGTVLALAWMPFTYINYYMQETDPLNMVFFLLGYDLIRRRKDAAFAALLPVAMINRETPVLLPLAWLLYRWDEEAVPATAAKFGAFCALAFGAYFGLRFVFGHHTAYAEFNDLSLNLRSFRSYLYFFLLFAPLVLPALNGLHRKPKFLRRLAVFLPYFLVFHFVIPIFQETRLFLPIFPIFIALAFTSFADPKEEVQKHEDVPAKSPWAAYSRKLFAASLLLFSAGIALYLVYLERAHVGDLRGKQKSEAYFKRGYEAYQNQEYPTAAREWEWGLLFDPEDYNVHYYLAVLYSTAMMDAERAARHLEFCRKMSPEDPKLKPLEEQVESLRQKRLRAVQ
ncbi:MAG: hypothetical protein HY548_09460 [Elusimicrobia bacterium]|nr:hypothetical protein [Elusimicrobiota bacterium]